MKHTSKIWQLVAAIGVTALLAACSDGELKLGPAPSESAPQIIKFEANPPQVPPGGSTELSWEVVGADTVEIASAPEALIGFHVGPLAELTSSTIVDGITESTDFILTASKTIGVESSPNEGGEVPQATIVIHKAGQIPIPGDVGSPSENPPEPTTYTVTATIPVTVVGPSEEIEITSFIADNTTVDGCGQSTEICWSVSPQDAIITITGNGETVVQGGNATGCATVTPTATTTYTLVATSGGNTGEQTLTITATGGNANIKSFKVNGRPDATVQSYDDPVEVAWEVEPAGAKVTITASPEVTDCELPTDASFNGNAFCTISADTTFTITVEACGDTETDEATVSRQSGQVADAACLATPWAFEGEKVTITADPDAIPDNDRSAIKQIFVAGKDYDLPADGPLVVSDIVVPAGGVDMVVESVSGIKIPHPNCVQAVVPTTLSVAQDITEFSRIVFDTEDTSIAYVGVKKNGYNSGIVEAHKVNIIDQSVKNDWNIDIGTILLATAASGAYWTNGDGRGFFEMVKDYPVSAIAVDENRVFVGTTGALVYSDNVENPTWTKLTTFLRFNTDDHKTCGGETQPGNGRDLGSLGRACDLIARDSHLIIATDRGVLTIKDIGAYIETKDRSLFLGRPPEGSFDEATYPTYAAVANDLEAADGGVVFAASEKGLFKSTDNGETWQKVEGIDEEIFSVVVDKQGEKIYVGSATAIKSKDLEGGSWESKEIGKKVLSLAADPYMAGVILAGTDGGLYVTRDNGANWSAVPTVGFNDKAVKTVAIAASEVGSNQLRYSISFGGEGGAVSDSVVVNAAVVAPAGGDEENPGGGDEIPSGLSFHSAFQQISSWFTGW